MDLNFGMAEKEKAISGQLSAISYKILGADR
jgi:hypothetical protein